MSTSTSRFEKAPQPEAGPSSSATAPTFVPVLDLLGVVLGWSIVLVGAAIVIISFGARAVRLYGEPGQQWGGGTATDGIRWFQGWALLCVLGTGILLIAAIWPRQPRWWLLPLPIAGFLFVARDTDAWRQTLLDERAGPRTHPAEIPVQASDGGPTLDAIGRPLHFETVMGTYQIRIPEELGTLILGSVVVVALTTLLMTLWLAEDIYRWRRTHDSNGIRPIQG